MEVKIIADIAFISTYPELTALVREVILETKDDITIVEGLLEDGAKVGVELQNTGAKVLISRGGTVLAIQEKVQIPVVEIPITGYDLARAISEAKQFGTRIGVIGFQNMLFQIEELAAIMGVELTKIELTAIDEAAEVIPNLKHSQFDALIGGVITVQTAQKNRFNTVMIRTGKSGIYLAIAEAKRILRIHQEERSRAKILQAILDYTTDGILVIDNQGTITAMNKKIGAVVGANPDEAVGQNILQVYPKTKMLQALRNGVPEYNKLEKIHGSTLAINRIPLELEGEVIGLVSTCQDVTYIEDLEKKYRREVLAKGNVAKHTFASIIGQSEAIQQATKKAERFASVESNIMIYGETGTGKEMFAQSIHNASLRKDAPFVAVNCAALPENLLESELFGYVDGAFTGAVKGGKRGLFELAHGGTIFLDEVSEMSPKLQARMLRVLQEREVRRIGDDRVIPVHLRVIAASNRDLAELVSKGEFREDLLYRLDLLRLTLPPLRKRSEDIELLVLFFIQEFSTLIGKRISGVQRIALQLLRDYPWPGNVRQLSNVVEQAVVLSEGHEIEAELIREILMEKKSPITSEPPETNTNPLFAIPGEKKTLPELMALVEQQVIRFFLDKNQGSQKQTAEELGMDRSTLWRKMNKG